MSTYTEWRPGFAVADAATRYTEAVNARRHPTTRPERLDQAARDAASQLTCPLSPTSTSCLAHHRFGINDDACAFCGETPAWILATPTPTGQPS